MENLFHSQTEVNKLSCSVFRFDIQVKNVVKMNQKTIIVFFLLLAKCLCFNVYDSWRLENTVDNTKQENEVKHLIARVIGDRASEFDVEVSPNFRSEDDGKMKASIVKEDGDAQVKIKASSGVGIAWILHHYLKYFCKSHISWETKQLSLPKTLPLANITLQAMDLFR